MPQRNPSPHGTHSRYSHGCRCDECRKAHGIYERDKRRQRARISYGFEPPVERFVSAEEATLHLQFLQRNGFGLEAASRASGVASSALRFIRQGRKKRILVTTHNKIMSVSLADRSDGQFIDASECRELLNELMSLGFKKADLGRALGDNGGHLYLGSWIRTQRARRIKELHGSWVKKVCNKTFVKGSLT